MMTKEKHLASPKQRRDQLNQGVLSGGRLGGGVVVGVKRRCMLKRIASSQTR